MQKCKTADAARLADERFSGSVLLQVLTSPVACFFLSIPKIKESIIRLSTNGYFVVLQVFIGCTCVSAPRMMLNDVKGRTS